MNGMKPDLTWVPQVAFLRATEPAAARQQDDPRSDPGANIKTQRRVFCNPFSCPPVWFVLLTENAMRLRAKV